MPLTFALVAGEASGDAQGAMLVEAIRRREPDACFVGVGGPQMKAAGVDLFYDSSGWGSIGIVESFRSVVPLARAKKQLIHHFSEHRPDLLIPIDFGYFNIRLIDPLHRLGVRVLWYFPPKSWSPSAYVSAQLRESVDVVATPFRWSADRMKEAGVPVSFVGHPALDSAKKSPGRLDLCREWQLNPDQPVVALLPGSRGHEVKYLWPPLVLAAEQVTRQLPEVQFIVPVAPTVDRAGLEKTAARLLRSPLRPLPFTLRLIHGRTPDVMVVADAAAICSGTATLEAAIRQRPMVILYSGSWIMAIEWALRKGKLNLPYIGMANWLAGRKIMNEFIGKEASPENIAGEILSMLTDRTRAEKMRADLAEATRSLGIPGAADRTALLAAALARGEFTESLLQEAWGDPGDEG